MAKKKPAESTTKSKSRTTSAPKSAKAAAASAPKAGVDLAPGSLVTFTIAKVPARPAQQKTIRRLMRMQPKIQSGLRKLSVRRQRDVNKANQRGGRMWITRARTTKLTHVGEGESFTITVTPQIIPDIRSVEKFLTVTNA